MELANINPDIVNQIKSIIEQARRNVTVAVNHELLRSYWQIGKLIADSEQVNHFNGMSERNFMLALSKVLTNELGRGFSRPNLINMKNFYKSYPDGQTVSDRLSWSHYCELLGVSDTDARGFYEKECLNAHWSIRELRRQIDSALFQRLLLSDGTLNKKKVLELAQKGQIIEKPEDILKDPYVLEFLGVPDDKPNRESELEKRLVERIEDFLLELGRGFMFVGTQQRVTIGNIHHFVDMVFYNKILKAYVLIDLKIGKFRLENAGQMNGYVNYYKTEVNASDDNPPIGIVLCADKDEVVAEFALGGLENQVFASKYTYYIPDKEQLIRQIEAVLEQDAQEAGES
ncbi:MAG: PDDEXK nuclease domain-containing protein [Gracilibacteraceae bacterium]|jgi:predicted nuclease of restriction endonuclease-like (RecB) superfamily|nr:PDDEXK nuclease domain-containing protein [Gracilibacteraceae bacterium]